MTVRIKFCGMTSPADAELAASLGVDAIGLVFVPGSRRAVDIALARQIIDAVPAFVNITALFMDPEEEAIARVMGELPVDLLQFHGSESPRGCEQLAQRYQCRYIKALGVQPADELRQQASQYRGAAGILLDSHAPGAPGGTGRTADWQALPTIEQRVILAGGLHAGNVAEAIATVRPFAVDVASGIESEPGMKDPQKMKSFVEEVRRVQQTSE
ncbi:MAG: phosphoribosylanthranilate isomerase [Gammaproteobacteria bacterium]|nr:phosphoribosylanthranilate isomerase [Gammaproteobacteria bacterium]